jgi:hypothetical protein
VVLPCTTKDQAGSAEFFELNNKRVMWDRPSNDNNSYASFRYEVVSGDALKGKIGIMSQSARIELLRWLKSRY